MVDVKFDGSFQKFRVVTKFHLGAISLDLVEGQIVEFNGSTLKLGGNTHEIPSLVGAIRNSWMVPTSDTTTLSVKPQPAGVKVRPAQSAGQERGAEMMVTEATEEDTVVGNVDDAVDRRQKALENSVLPKKPALKMEVISSENEDAVPVGAIQTPAKMDKVILTGETASSISRQIQQMDNTPPPKVKKASTVIQDDGSQQSISRNLPNGATGDVQETTTGSSLESLLPDAANASKPSAEFTWDLKGHWRTRVKNAIQLQGDNPTLFKQVMSVETDTVQKHVAKELAAKG